MTLPIALVGLYICIFVVGIFLLLKIIPSFRRAEVKWLIVFIFAVCVISFCSLNVYVIDTFEAKVTFSRWRFIGHGVVAQAWFFFLLLTFTPLKILKSPLLVVPLVISMLITVSLAVIPGLSHWLVTDFAPFRWSGANIVTFSNGPWFKLHIIIAYVCALTATLYAVFAIPFSRGPKRKQLIALSIGGLAGLAVDMYCVATNSPLRWAMLSGGTYLITEASILYAITKFGMLDLTSVAKDQIFHSISDPLLIIDQERNLIDCNYVAKGVFKIDEKDLFKPFKELVIFKDFDLCAPTQEWTYSDNPPAKRQYQVVSEPLKSHSGRILLFHETTAQKDIESNLNSRLDFKAKLLGLIAHDFSGILSAQSYLSSQLEKEVTPELRAHVGHLANSAYAGEDFMTNILVWARAQEHQFRPITRDFEFNALISEVVNNLESLWRLKGIKIEIDTQAKPLVIKGDPVMMESVLRNILTNAIRATFEDGNIKVSLSTDTERAVLSVQDDGVGMSAGKLKVIKNNSSGNFNNEDERPDNFGLGLVFAKRFVELHGGLLDFESSEGEGTSVTLTLPL